MLFLVHQSKHHLECFLRLLNINTVIHEIYAIIYTDRIGTYIGKHGRRHLILRVVLVAGLVLRDELILVVL